MLSFVKDGKVNVRKWFNEVPERLKAGLRPLIEEDLRVGEIILMAPVEPWDSPGSFDVKKRTIPLKIIGIVDGKIQYHSINGCRVYGPADAEELIAQEQEVAPLERHPFALFLAAVA